MAIGYEGYAKLNNVLFLCTGASIPRTRNRLDSASGYAGQWATGIGSPHDFDYDTFDGSISFDLTQDLFAEIRSWLNPGSGRYTSRGIQVVPRKGSSSSFDECYWTSISLTASESSLVSGSVNFIGISGPDVYSPNDDYIGNRTGLTSGSELLSGASIPSLNKSGNLDPVPYWKTQVVGGWATSGIVKPRTWTITFNQDVQRLYTCRANATSQATAYVGIGPITAELQVEFVLVGGSITVAKDISGVSIDIAGTSIGLGALQLTTSTDDVQTDVVPLNLTYDIYGPISA
jgi:hypothetical protein